MLAKKGAAVTGVDVLTNEAARKFSGAGHGMLDIRQGLKGGLGGVMDVAQGTARGIVRDIRKTGGQSVRGHDLVKGVTGGVVGFGQGLGERVLKGTKGTTQIFTGAFKGSQNSGQVKPIDGGEIRSVMEADEHWDGVDDEDEEGQELMSMYGRNTVRNEVNLVLDRQTDIPGSIGGVENPNNELFSTPSVEEHRVSFRGRGPSQIGREKDVELGVLREEEGGLGLTPVGSGVSQQFLTNVLTENN